MESTAIRKQFEANRTVDLRRAVPSRWDRVCILGPYSDDEAAQSTLGFAWPLESKSSIKTSDSITLLVFARGKEVVRSVEHPRGSGDFSNLSGRCFRPDKAQFIHVERPREGWPGMFPEAGA
ncbi:hypothetical protein [Lysobacter humi (ex Lee et al. 2017)]